MVEKYIHKCIDSVINAFNGHENKIEIILVNDGSPDNCGKIIDEYAKKHKHIIVMHKENGGLSDARNHGIDKATGEYLAFVDSDDWVDESMVELLEIIKANRGIDVIHVGYTTVKEDGEVIEASSNKPLGLFSSDQENFLRNIIISPTSVRKIINRKFLIRNNLYFLKGIACEDEEWSIRVYMSVVSCYNSNINYYKYFINRDGSIITNYSRKHVDDVLMFSKKNFELVDESSISDNNKRILKRAIANTLWFCLMQKLLRIEGTRSTAKEFKKHRKYLKSLKGKRVFILRTLTLFFGYRFGTWLYAKTLHKS